MKIIQARLKDMPSSLLAELGSYRYGIFARGEGWSIPPRLSTPGQEYDRFDRSDVVWLIAWDRQQGICGCARLMPWEDPAQKAIGNEVVNSRQTAGTVLPVWEMSRFSARLDIDPELPLSILWHCVQLAEQSGIASLYSTATPMLVQIFEQYSLAYEPLTAGIIRSEDNLFAVCIPVKQPNLANRYRGARRFSPEEVLPALGVSSSWNARGR
ncbi:autoinducer synthase [Erwinia endophytica]|uniref:autoinducer synthase n=1 Tax=Erwinia endophytica TaxID=1563158 RepID=UPI001265EA51|nr:autoinducer synthase [Erwinia endophytica]KAB8313375.1 autoinducer synthase [Erwinia endophytica]